MKKKTLKKEVKQTAKEIEYNKKTIEAFRSFGYVLKRNQNNKVKANYEAYRKDGMFGTLYSNSINNMIDIIDVAHMVKFQ